MTTDPRRQKGLALVTAFAGTSLLFFSLARPVREWAGGHWHHLFIAVAMAAVISWAVAWQLWERR